MLFLSADDRRLLEKLKADGILIPVPKVPHELILLTCGDGDQEIVFFFHEYPHLLMGKTRHHTHTQNGAYLQSPKWAKEEIMGSALMKHINQVSVCGHAPCGKADQLHLTVKQQLEEQQRLVADLRRQMPEVEILSHFHVNWGGQVELLELRD